jgi:hypothetical protein
MSLNRWIWRILLIGLVAALAGCATPKPILDLAGQGTATVALAEIELRDYLAATNAQLGARMDLMRSASQQEVRDASRREFDQFLDREAGLAKDDGVAKKIQDLGNERRRLREKALEAIKAKETQFQGEVAGLPTVPTEKLAAAKKSFGVLAQELTPKEWVHLVAAHAREIKAGIDKLRAAKAPLPVEQ